MLNNDGFLEFLKLNRTKTKMRNKSAKMHLSLKLRIISTIHVKRRAKPLSVLSTYRLPLEIDTKSLIK